jgi:hypothetical protein
MMFTAVLLFMGATHGASLARAAESSVGHTATFPRAVAGRAVASPRRELARAHLFSRVGA